MYFKVVIYLPLRENERRLVIANEDFLSALDLSNFLRGYGIVSTVQEIPPRGRVDFDAGSIVICEPSRQRL